MYKYPSVMTIAGFDSSGGAGLQADIKTISALGCYATSVITALPVQNTTGVKSIYQIPIEAVKEQIKAILDDIVPDAIKIGMVHSKAMVLTLADTLKNYPGIPVIFDPVMIATSGDLLIQKETIEVIVKELLPIVDLITPNMDEAGILSHTTVKSLNDIQIAGPIILESGCPNVLIKGGHLSTELLTSMLFSLNRAPLKYKSSKINTNNIHGSGCTLSSAIASFIARKMHLQTAIEQAQSYVHKSILAAQNTKIGKGNGPLNHFHNPLKTIKYELV